MSLPHRYYCPRCGEVRCGLERQEKLIVPPHYRQRINHNHLKESHQPCLGGEVDRKADRAP